MRPSLPGCVSSSPVAGPQGDIHDSNVTIGHILVTHSSDGRPDPATMLHEMTPGLQARAGTMCVGGGQGVAALFELARSR